MEAEELDRLAEQTIGAYNRRDPEAMVKNWDPECEWHPFFAAEVEGAQGYRGHDGMRQWFRDTDEMFSEVALRVDEVHDLGDDRALILGELQGRGRASGVEVKSPVGQLFEVRGSLLLRGWAYPSHEEARRAAGLEA